VSRREDVRAANAEADKWIGAEDFVRWISNQRPDRYMPRLGFAAFTADDYVEFFGGDRKKEAALRHFERWKNKWGYPSGFLTKWESLNERDEDLLESALASRTLKGLSSIYLVPLAELKGRVDAAISRRDELIEASRAMSGRKKRRPPQKVYERDTPAREAADRLGVPYRTFMFWITRDGAPHDRVKRKGRGGHPYEFRVSAEEIADWVEAQKGSQRKKKLVERARVPVDEFAANLRRVMKKLNLSAPAISKKLGVSASSIRQALSPGSKARAKTVGISLVEKLHELEEEGTVYASRVRGSFGATITGPDLQAVLDRHGGNMTAAAASLGVDRGAVERAATRYGLVWARQTESLVDWVTREDLRQVFSQATSYKDAAVRLGASVAALFKIVKRYGMQDEALKLMGKKKSRAPVTREEVEAALVAHEGDVNAAARALGYAEVYKLRPRVEAFGLEHLAKPPKVKPPPLTKRQVQAAIAKAKKEDSGIGGAVAASGRAEATFRRHAEAHGLLDKVKALSKKGRPKPPRVKRVPRPPRVPLEREDLLALIRLGDESGWTVEEIIEAAPGSRSVFFRRIKEHGLGHLLGPARSRAKRSGAPPKITEKDVLGVITSARELGISAYAAAKRAGFTGTGIEGAARRYGLLDAWQGVKYMTKRPPRMTNPPRRFDVRSPAQGLKAIQHPAITENYEKALRVKPKHKKAVLVPCAGTKPFPDAPSHKHGYLEALEGKGVDLYVVSEPLGVVPYEWSRRYPQAHYDFPPEHLRGRAHDVLAGRITSWFKRVGPKYKKITLALPAHHMRLADKALDMLGYEPTKIVYAGIGDCLNSGACPPGNVRPTTKAYRKFLKKRANPPEELGDCYQAALDYMTDRAIQEGDASNLRLIHATVMGQGPIAGQPHGHAWVEELVPPDLPPGATLPPYIDPMEYGTWWAVDRSGGRGVRVPAAFYRFAGQAHGVRGYTYDQARREVSKHKHYGPWPESNPWRLNESGSDWWEEPTNLREQILLDKVNRDTMSPLLGEKMIRRGNHNWTKWEWVHRSPGGWKDVVHFWKTPQGERVEPKFKYVPPGAAFDPKPVDPDSPMDYEIDRVDRPVNLREKLVYEIVMAGEQPENEKLVKFSNVTMEPFISLHRKGWRKWQHKHVSRDGRLTVVNFWKSKRGERVFPKFMREARPYAKRSKANPPPRTSGRAFFGSGRTPVEVIRPAWSGDKGYWDVVFLDDGEEATVSEIDLYTTDGERWRAPVRKPGRQAWTNNPPMKACDPSKRPLKVGPLKGKFVRTHVNLHNGCFVVSYKSKVQGYTKALKLKDVRPRVGNAGWQRCNTSQVRNVHAFLDGELVSGKAARKTGKGWREISYHCKTHGPYFFFVDTDKPFRGAKEVICRKVMVGGAEKAQVFVRGPEPARKNPPDCECGAPEGICSCGEVDSWIEGDPEKIAPCGSPPRQVGVHVVDRPWGRALLVLDAANLKAYTPRDWHERGRCPLLAAFSILAGDGAGTRIARDSMHDELAHHESSGRHHHCPELSQLAARCQISLEQAEDLLCQEGVAWHHAMHGPVPKNP
jgi:hypothetical protein